MELVYRSLSCSDDVVLSKGSIRSVGDSLSAYSPNSHCVDASYPDIEKENVSAILYFPIHIKKGKEVARYSTTSFFLETFDIRARDWYNEERKTFLKQSVCGKGIGSFWERMTVCDREPLVLENDLSFNDNARFTHHRYVSG